MRILIAEDDPDMRKILTLYLKKEGYSVTEVENGEKALSYLESEKADLLLLDWMMPIKDGIDVCKEVRSLNIPLKILMLTAKSENDHEILGLTMGADDYIRKPFDMKVLLLRIKKLCRQEHELRCGELSLNQQTMLAHLGEKKLVLTKTEFELLRFFMLNVSINLSREQLLAGVWGQEYEGDTRTVDTHVRRLRAKIGEDRIKTNIGMGYTLEYANE